ncbi:MAG: PQQ-dependent sugar dehydrogenase [Bryobacteraceae bacterium]
MTASRLAFSFLLVTSMVRAQQAPAPGIPVAPLGNGPFLIDTAEQHKVRISIVARGIAHPFGFAFLPGGDMLVTERAGKLRLIRNGLLMPEPVKGVPAVRAAGGGLLDIVPDPKFAENKRLYFTFSKPVGEGNDAITVLARAKWEGDALVGIEELVTGSVKPRSSGARIAFGRDGMVYMTTGGPFDNDSQEPGSIYGKVLRVTMDGKAPPDNPFVGKAGYRPEVFSMGHRDQLGLTIHPVTGQVLAVEHGPNGGDELNLIEAGKNYGWPLVSYGRQYDGSKVADKPTRDGITDPVVLWIPSIAPSGLLVYSGDKFPAWKGNLFVGSNREGEIPGTGHLERVVFNDKLQELRRESMFTELHQRVRDVRQGPDGFIYMITDENDGAVLRVEPAN